MFCQEQRRRLTMDDLISRQAAIALAYFHGKTPTWDNPIPDGIDAGVDAVDVADLKKLPAVKIEPKTGRWIFEKGDGETCVDGYICSACGRSYHTNVPYWSELKFCPNCGAIMVGGKI